MPETPSPYSPELASGPTATELLDVWSDGIDRLSDEISPDSGDHALPDWWHETRYQVSTSGLQQLLKLDDADPAEISRYCELHLRESKVRIGTNENQFAEPMKEVIYNLGPDAVAKGFRSEPEGGPIRSALLSSLAKIVSNGRGVAMPELEVLKKAYGAETMTDLLSLNSDNYQMKIRSLLLKPCITNWIIYSDQAKKDGESSEESRSAYGQWLSSAIEAATGIPHEEAMDYAFPASRQPENTNLGDIIEKFDHFGIDRIRRITEITGIVGLDKYSVRQLERMDRLISDPENFALSLRNHDVTILMVNRVGDQNGVMSGAAADFDDSDNERVLFFEIASATDIFRSMITINKYGIKPSTLVVSAHGAPGEFVISDDRNRNLTRHDLLSIAGRRAVALANDNPELESSGIRLYSMHGMKGMARIVSDYMDPSRGVDDAVRDKGRKKIIFQACNAGTDVERTDVDGYGERISTGEESVISQLGRDLMSSGVLSGVDIYGAPDGIQMHRTSKGVRYSARPTSFGEGRIPISAVRVSIDNDKLAKSKVEEVILRN